MRRAWAFGVALAASVAVSRAGAEPSIAPAYTFELGPAAAGHDLGSWSKVSGLDVTFDVVEHENGKELLLRKRPGRAKLTLTGAAMTDALAAWWKASAAGKGAKKTLALGVLDHVSGRKGADKRRCAFTLRDAALTGLRKRELEQGKKKVVVYEIDVTPAEVTNTCAELFKHPRDRKKS
jgi:hypothetical protein